MIARSLAVVGLALAALGCTGEPPFLVVDFATDLAGGSDFVAIESRLTRDGQTVGEGLAVAFLGDSFFEPVRLASFAGLSAGDHRLDVTLTDLAGDVVAERSVLVTVRAPLAVTVVISAACVGATCPGAGDAPEDTECVAGRCIDPRCSDVQPEYCPAPCLSHEECLEGRCVGGVCLGGELPDRCDDRDPCTRDSFVAGACLNEPDTGGGCDDGVFCNGPDTCQGGACTDHGTPPCGTDRCDEAARTCDAGCDTDADCPQDVVGTWLACEYEAPCAEQGVRTRTVTSFRCETARCVSDAREEMDEASCDRDTDGVSCGTSGCDDWSACTFAPCRTSGDQWRSCWAPTCRSGACDTSTTTDMMPCTRPSQEGTSCSPSGLLCTGVCQGGSCGALCEHCGGACTVVGCRYGSCP